MFVHKSVEVPVDQAEVDRLEALRAQKEEDPLASTEEDEASTKEKLVNLKEIDRLHYHVRSIENDCHIVPMGALRLNSKHEVQRSENFLGLPPSEVFDLKCYSHFRNVQNKDKKAKLEADDAVF